ncbi:MAG: glucan biosynthesis protein [bacterium]|nr:glucan biosynthesis protein [bacterium]
MRPCRAAWRGRRGCRRARWSSRPRASSCGPYSPRAAAEQAGAGGFGARRGVAVARHVGGLRLARPQGSRPAVKTSSPGDLNAAARPPRAAGAPARRSRGPQPRGDRPRLRGHPDGARASRRGPGPLARGVRRLLVLVGLALALAARGALAFGLGDVEQVARTIAAEPYRDRQTVVPPWMLKGGAMTYDQWRDIRFRPERALWRDEKLPFQVQLFHPGLYFDRSVQVHVVDRDRVEALPFATRYFDYGKNTFEKTIPEDIGWAGIRIHAPLKTPEYFDEVIVFLGASYFRAVGRDNVYGLSARGVAVDTVEPTGEEFPRFIELWLETPAPDATSLVVYALLDGPSLSGAYRFAVTPGVQTVVDVDARLFLRRAPKVLGLAPLTSMFLFGENGTRCVDDFRPEVHDSDGLLVQFASGEWLWRPLDNPTRIDVAALATRDPRGFGLIQRDRDFRSHQDIETRAELRPSAWVAPKGDWGAGQVRLVTIPTKDELMDNVVAFWVPDVLPPPGEPLAYGYVLSWYGDDPARPPAGRVVATRRDHGAVGTPRTGHRWVLDFEGEALAGLGADAAPRAVVTASGGATIFDEHVYKNPVTGGWRLTFQMEPKDAAPVELRAFLERRGQVLTETWSSAWLP